MSTADGSTANGSFTFSFIIMRTLLIATGVSLLASFAAAQSQPQLNLMPMPASVQVKTGQLVVDPSFTVGIS